MLKRFIICFAIFFMIFGNSLNCKAAPEDNPAIRLTKAEYLSQAATLLKDGKGEEAWRMLSNLLREEPDNVQVNLLLSQAGFATGRDNQAINAIERIVELYPDNASLRLALAKAYARAGDEAAYQSELAEAKSLNPEITNEEQEQNLEKTVKLVSKSYDRFKANGRLALGVIWDSNATGGLDSLDVDIQSETFRLQEDAEKKAAFGQYANANLNMSWRLSEDSPWHLAGGVDFYGKIYDRDIPSNQWFTWGRAALGLRYLSEKSMFDIRGHFENASFEPFDSMSGWGGEVTYAYSILPQFQLIAKGGLDSRAYMTWDGKDGTYWNAGIYGRYLFGEKQNSVLAGVKYIGSQTTEQKYSYDGFEAMLRLDIPLIKQLTFSPFVAWRQSVYHEPATRLSDYLGEDNRWDNLWIAGCGFTWQFNEYVGVEVGYQYLKNFSNSAFYRYDQHQINTGVVFSF